MLAIDTFFALLARCSNANRLFAPFLAVVFLHFSGMEQSEVVLAFIFAVIALAPYVLVVTSVAVGMKALNFVDWSWMDVFVPASSLLVLPLIGLLIWFAQNLRLEVTLKNTK